MLIVQQKENNAERGNTAVTLITQRVLQFICYSRENLERDQNSWKERLTDVDVTTTYKKEDERRRTQSVSKITEFCSYNFFERKGVVVLKGFLEVEYPEVISGEQEVLRKRNILSREWGLHRRRRFWPSKFFEEVCMFSWHNERPENQRREVSMTQREEVVMEILEEGEEHSSWRSQQAACAFHVSNFSWRPLSVENEGVYAADFSFLINCYSHFSRHFLGKLLKMRDKEINERWWWHMIFLSQVFICFFFTIHMTLFHSLLCCKNWINLQEPSSVTTLLKNAATYATDAILMTYSW